MSPLLISVILPTFNRKELLFRAIQSVRRQTYPHWELLVIDDGSTDGSDTLIASAAAEDSRIRAFRIAHAGPAAARNQGLERMRGAWAAFLDSDDEYEEPHLALRAAIVTEDTGIDMLYGGFQFIGDPDRRSVPDRRDPSRLIPIEECIVGGTFFCRAGIIQKAGWWRAGYGEDADLFERLQSIAVIRSVPHRTYLYHRDIAGSRCDTAGISDGTALGRTESGAL